MSHFLCLPHFGRFPHSGTTLSYPSAGLTLSGKSVKYDPDLQNSEYSYLCIQNEGPSQVIQFMGIIVDSGKMEARLPEDKVERIKSALSNFQSRRSATLQELQSLIGTLNFACKVIAPGRPLLQRIIHLTRGVKKPHHHIKLTTGFYKDIKMWKMFIDQWNGIGLFLSPLWENSDTLSESTNRA